MTVLTRLIGSGGYAFDAFCSSYGLEGTLGEMSSRLARCVNFVKFGLDFLRHVSSFSLNLLSESPSNVCGDRNVTFDLTFTMLTRIVYKYSNLVSRFYLFVSQSEVDFVQTLDELVTDPRGGQDNTACAL